MHSSLFVVKGCQGINSMFLKRKRCGKVKGRGCADGRKQRAWTDEADSSSPTIATAAMFLTVIIDALEGRDVAVIDVPGAFMQADMDELVHVRFTGLMVDKLLEIDYEIYAPFIVYEGKVKCLYCNTSNYSRLSTGRSVPPAFSGRNCRIN
jgi:hypothetical protein